MIGVVGFVRVGVGVVVPMSVRWLWSSWVGWWTCVSWRVEGRPFSCSFASASQCF